MAKRRSTDSIICIDLTEDDYVREEKLQDVRKRLKSSPPTAATAATASEASTSVSVDHGGAVTLTIHPPVASCQEKSETDQDVIVVLGTANECRLPHMRQHCPEHKFVQDVGLMINREETLAPGNLAFCDLCYCYICDKPAKDCTMWGATNIGGFHSHASDAGMFAPLWRNLRMEAKKNHNGTKQQGKAQSRHHTVSTSHAAALRSQPIHSHHHHHVPNYDCPLHVVTIPVQVPPVLFAGRKMLVTPPWGGTKLVTVPQGIPPGALMSVRVLVPPVAPHIMPRPYPPNRF